LRGSNTEPDLDTWKPWAASSVEAHPDVSLDLTRQELSYRRETALQGGSVLAKSGR